MVFSYMSSIGYIAWERYREDQEDMFQWGMIGVLKGIRTIDIKRVKSPDAWIFLNARSMMANHKPKRENLESLDAELPDSGFTLADTLGKEHDYNTTIDLLAALKNSGSLSEVREKLEHSGYYPSVRKNNTFYLKLYKENKLSLRQLAAEMGVSRRQAYKLTGELPLSW